MPDLKVNRQAIIRIIAKGVLSLGKYQQSDGSFLSLSSPDPISFNDSLKFHSTFSTSLILSCLTSLPETPILKVIKQKAAHFLISQKSEYWSFNYWARNSKEAKTMPYPDDLDDTFCALSALFQYKPKLITGEVLAHIVKLLITQEKKEGGPYKTWIVSKASAKVWQDVDLAVNSNIANFLSQQDIDLPNLNEYIESNIKKENLKSPYYPSIYPIIYFISRFYTRDKLNKIKSSLLLKRNRLGFWDNPLNTSLAISSLLNLNTLYIELEKAVLYLIKNQTNGIWKPFPFYTGVNPKKDRIYYAGSSPLSTAFCLEALAKYLKKTQEADINYGSYSRVKRINRQKNKDIDKKEEIYNHIVEKVKKRFSSFKDPMLVQAATFIDLILKEDSKLGNQIVLTPFNFKLTLGENGKRIKDKLLISLGYASTLGWIAYTIYDDFLDDEGNPKNLAIANVSLRELTRIFSNLFKKNTQFIKLFHKVLDKMEEANTWEVTNRRLKINKELSIENLVVPSWKDYEILADRSFGHALGPLALLFSLGFNQESPEVKNIIKFFRHFLIAKQLNDDAHDFKIDLLAGHLNPVVLKLLVKLKEEHKLTGILLEALVPKIEKLFWQQVITEVCQDIIGQIELAKEALNKIEILRDKTFFEGILNPLKQAADKALEEHENSRKFLKVYESDDSF